VGFWGAPSINMALLTELSKSRVPLKTGKNRVLARLPRPVVGTPRTLPDGIAAEARAIALPAWLSLGRITVFTYSNLVHSPAEKGLPVEGRLLWLSRSEERLGTTNTLASMLVWCLRIASTFRRLPKAVEDYRTPRRFAFSGTSERAPASWSAPALWRFGIQMCRQF
jgi:hypothetical protein